MPGTIGQLEKNSNFLNFQKKTIRSSSFSRRYLETVGKPKKIMSYKWLRGVITYSPEDEDIPWKGAISQGKWSFQPLFFRGHVSSCAGRKNHIGQVYHFRSSDFLHLFQVVDDAQFPMSLCDYDYIQLPVRTWPNLLVTTLVFIRFFQGVGDSLGEPRETGDQGSKPIVPMKMCPLLAENMINQEDFGKPCQKKMIGQNLANHLGKHGHDLPQHKRIWIIVSIMATDRLNVPLQWWTK